MTNKEKAMALMASIMDRENDDTQREQDLNSLVALKKAAKTSYEKLGVSQAMVEREQQKLLERQAMKADLADDPLAEPVPATEILNGDPVAIVAKGKPAKPSGDQRGLISAEVRCLLMDTDDSYKLIVEAVKAKFPEANTTTRSVASVAAELRKNGVEIAFRRPSKGA